MRNTQFDWPWYVLAAVLASAALVIGIVALFRDRSRGRRRCPKCWYSMEGAPGTVCPECGKDAGSDKGLLKTRKSWGRLWVAVVVFAASYLAWQFPTIKRRGWVSLMPTLVLIEIAPTTDFRPVMFRTAMADLPASYWLQAEADTRLFLGSLWNWQARRYVARMIAGNRLDITRIVLPPHWWVRGKPLPAVFDGELWDLTTMQVQTSPGFWSSDRLIQIQPPLPSSLHIPVRLLVNGEPVGEIAAPLRCSLVDTIDEIFDPRAGPEVDGAVAAVLRPGLATLDGTWRLMTFNGDPVNGGPAQSMVIAFRAEVVYGGQVVGRARGELISRSLGWENSTIHEIEWIDGVPPDFDAGRATLVFSGDLAGAWERWSLEPFGVNPAKPPAWTGRFECPAVPEESPK